MPSIRSERCIDHSREKKTDVPERSHSEIEPPKWRNVQANSLSQRVNGADSSTCTCIRTLCTRGDFSRFSLGFRHWVCVRIYRRGSNSGWHWALALFRVGTGLRRFVAFCSFGSRLMDFEELLEAHPKPWNPCDFDLTCIASWDGVRLLFASLSLFFNCASRFSPLCSHIKSKCVSYPCLHHHIEAAWKDYKERYPPFLQLTQIFEVCMIFSVESNSQTN